MCFTNPNKMCLAAEPSWLWVKGNEYIHRSRFGKGGTCLASWWQQWVGWPFRPSLSPRGHSVVSDGKDSTVGEEMQFPTENSGWSGGRLCLWGENELKSESAGHRVMSDSVTPMDCSLSGSSVHGILQARMLEWVAISFFRGSSWPRDRTWVSCIAGRFFNRAPFKAGPGAGLPVLGKEGACPWSVSE